MEGDTAAVKVSVSPIASVIDVLFRLTLVTEIGETVTEHAAVLPPSFVFTVIIALPTAFAVTTPEEETVATDVLLEDQVTDLSVAFDGETVAIKVYVAPSIKVRKFLSRLTLVTEIGETVTEHAAVLPPSFVFTVIVALPTAFAVTTPEEETVATDVLLEDQVTDLSVAFEGETVAVKVYVAPSVNVRELLSRLTLVTEIGETVTEHLAVLPPSLVFTVIVALPTAFAVTTPEEETVATDVLLEDQVTDLSVAFDGETMAVKVYESPSVKVRELLFRVTLVTEIGETVTEHAAVLPPSLVFTVIVVLPTTFAVTTPEEETVATDVLLEDHVTDLSVAFDGETVAVKVYVAPSGRVSFVQSKLTLSTGITLDITVTAHVAVLDPSFVFTVIVALPAVLASKTPEDETSTTDVLFDDQVTV